MKSKRYTVEAQAQSSTTCGAFYYANDLDQAQRYAASTALAPAIRATRVVDQETGEVVSNEPAEQP